LGCASGGQVDHGGDHGRHRREHSDGQRVVPVGDGERVEGRGEEIVGEQPPGDGRRQCRPEASDERHPHHGEQVQKEVARQVEGAAQVGQQHGQQGKPAGGDEETEDAPATAESATEAVGCASEAGLVVCHHMNVDRTGLPDGGGSDAWSGEPGAEPGPAGIAEDELRRVLGTGKGEQRRRDVVAEHLVVAAAQGFDQRLLFGEGFGIAAGEPVPSGDVHGEQVGATPRRDPGCPSDEGCAFGTAAERDDDTLTGLPGGVDAVRGRTRNSARCGGSPCTWSRRPPATPATPTSFGRRSMVG